MRSILTTSALESNTMVTITSVAGNNTFRLEKYQTFEMSSGADMSGSLVEASKPVVVLSDNYFRNLPMSATTGNSSPLLQMVLPPTQRDNMYIIPELQTRPDLFIDINYNALNYFESDNDVTVMLFPNSIDAKHLGDVFIMHIPGIHQYLSRSSLCFFFFFLPEFFQSKIISRFMEDSRN